MFRQWLQDERGATAIEYALLASMMAIAAIVGLGLLGTATKDSLWKRVGDAFDANIK